MKYKSWVGLYGNTRLERCICPNCQGTAFVENGRSACCEAVIKIPKIYKRESIPQQKRRLPPLKERQQCLIEQNNRCIYCERQFGQTIVHHNRFVILHVEWDHFVPYCYQQNNRAQNFVAACQICNQKKGSKLFQTIEEVRLYVFTTTTETKEQSTPTESVP